MVGGKCDQNTAAVSTRGEFVEVPLDDPSIPPTWRKKVYLMNGRLMHKWTIWFDPDGNKLVNEAKVRQIIKDGKERENPKKEESEENVIYEDKVRAVEVAISDDDSNTPTCEICSLDFMTQDEFDSHQELHNQVPANPPPTELKTIPKVSSNPNYNDFSKCTMSHCNETFPMKENLRDHMYNKHPDKMNGPFSCDICFISYSVPKGVLKHKKSKHQNPTNTLEAISLPKSISERDISSNDQYVPKTDLREDNNCDGDFFSTSIDTKREYIKNIEDQISYKVEQIEETVEKVEHQKIKFDEDPVIFTCHLCSATFSFRGKLSSHQKVEHYGSKAKQINNTQFSCDQCASKFISKWNFDRHVMNSHPEQGAAVGDIIKMSNTVKDSDLDCSLDNCEQMEKSLILKDDDNEAMDCDEFDNENVKVDNTKLDEINIQTIERSIETKKVDSLHEIKPIPTIASGMINDYIDNEGTSKGGLDHKTYLDKDYGFSDEDEDVIEEDNDYVSMDYSGNADGASSELEGGNTDVMSILDRYKHVISLKEEQPKSEDRSNEPERLVEQQVNMAKDANNIKLSISRVTKEEINPSLVATKVERNPTVSMTKDELNPPLSHTKKEKNPTLSVSKVEINPTKEEINPVFSVQDLEVNPVSYSAETDLSFIKSEGGSMKTNDSLENNKEIKLKVDPSGLRACKLCNATFLKKKQLIKHLIEHKENATSKALVKPVEIIPVKSPMKSKANTAITLNKDTIVKREDDSINGILKAKPELSGSKSIDSSSALTCNLCGKTYSTKKSLKQHTEKKHSTVFGSDITTKTLNRSSDKSIGNITIKSEAPSKGTLESKFESDSVTPIHFSVNHSNNSATQRQCLQKSSVNKIICETCLKEFASKASLTVHRKAVHEGVRFPCESCDYKATTNKNLKLHHETKHGDVKFTCSSCPFIAANSLILTNHEKKNHP